jgi:type 1 glutamine amidotransferase
LDGQTQYWPQYIDPDGNLTPIAVPRSVPNPVEFTPLGIPDRNPIAWEKTYGNGRVFYTNLGHAYSTWQRADYQDHVLGGIEWASGIRPNQNCITNKIG